MVNRRLPYPLASFESRCAAPSCDGGEQRVKGRYERAAQPASDGLLSGEGKGRFPIFGISPSVPGSIRCRIVRRVSLASVTGPSGRILWGNVTPSNLEPRRCRRLHRASPHQRFRQVQRVPIGRSSDRGQESGRRGPSGRFWDRRSESRSGVRRLPRGAWSPKARGRSRDTQQESDGAFLGVRFLSAESAQVIQCAGLPLRHDPLSAFLTLSAAFSHLGLVALFHATSAHRIPWAFRGPPPSQP